MRLPPGSAAAAAIGFLASICGCAAGAAGDGQRTSDAITAGTSTHDHPEIGVTTLRAGNVSSAGCIVTLIAPRYALTSALCVDQMKALAGFLTETEVFFLDAHDAPMTRVERFDVVALPDLDASYATHGAHARVGLLRLDEDVTGIAPATLASTVAAGSEPATLVGLECSGANKRAYTTTLDPIAVARTAIGCNPSELGAPVFRDTTRELYGLLHAFAGRGAAPGAADEYANVAGIARAIAETIASWETPPPPPVALDAIDGVDDRGWIAGDARAIEVYGMFHFAHEDAAPDARAIATYSATCENGTTSTGAAPGYYEGGAQQQVNVLLPVGDGADTFCTITIGTSKPFRFRSTYAGSGAQRSGGG